MVDASKASTMEPLPPPPQAPQPRTYHAADASHALVALLEARGWSAAAEPADAAVVLPAKGAPLPCAPRPGQHVWCNGCLALACKARLFEALAGAAAPRWPDTWVLRSGEALDAWAAREADGGGGGAPRYFVKHPRAGGGKGTFPAATRAAAAAVAARVLAAAGDAVVVQRAVRPARLPRGPSFFELRVWALLTRDAASLFSEHRAKTATAGLMNKRVQRDRPRANRPGSNFTHLGHVDVDAADVWTTRCLSAER